MRKKVALFFALTVLIGMMSACGQPTSSQVASVVSSTSVTATDTGSEASVAGASDRPSIGVVMLNFVSQYYVDFMEAMQDGCDEMGIDVTFKSDETNIETEIAMIESFIQQEVDIIAFDAVNDTGLEDTVQKIVDAGIIPVSMFNILSFENENMYTFASEQYDGYYDLTCAAIELVGEGGNICVASGTPGQYSTEQRILGFYDAMEDYPTANLLTLQPTNYDSDKAVSLVEDWLVAYDDINMIMCLTDNFSPNVVDVLEKAGVKDDIMVTGYDGLADGIQLMMDGKLVGDVYAGAKRTGYFMTKCLAALVEGKEMPKLARFQKIPVFTKEVGDIVQEKYETKVGYYITPEECWEMQTDYKSEFEDFDTYIQEIAG